MTLQFSDPPLEGGARSELALFPSPLQNKSTIEQYVVLRLIKKTKRPIRRINNDFIIINIYFINRAEKEPEGLDPDEEVPMP